MPTKMPTIRTARAIAKQGELQGCIVIGFSNGVIGAASYGSTMEGCRQLGKLVDFITDAVGEGAVFLGEFNPAS